MESAPDHIIRWVGANILPHETDLRAWLRRARLGREDVEDIIQEAYCKVAELSSVDHILSPRAYFFTVAKNIAFMRIRRARIVRIDTVDEIERLDVMSDAPSPERETAARYELARVMRLIAALPSRCRQVFEMRKVQGLPQKEIARVLGLSETTVENEAAKGLRLIMRSMASEDQGHRSQKELKRDAARHN